MLESALENSSGQNTSLASGIALGRITAVDPKKRFCEVKTFFGDSWLVDKHIPQCQWLSPDANPEGDESTSIPRVNSTGLVFFVAGEPFIWEYFRATTRKAGATTGKEIGNLNEGDKIISTIGGNSIIIKANGVVQIQSKETLKTLYFPKTGLLSHLCEAYEIRADGGNISWKTISDLNETLHQAEYRRDLTRTSVVFEERGAVTSDIMHRMQIGPAIPGTKGVVAPIFSETISLLGEVTTEVGIAGTGVSFLTTPLGGHTMKNILSTFEMSKTGDFSFITPLAEVKIGATGDISLKGPVASMSLAATGDIAVKNALSTASLSASGDIKIEAPAASISITVAGEVKITSLGKTTIEATAGMDLKSTGPMNLEALGPIQVKALTIGLDGSGGGGAINNVLCFPMTVSQFTGSPLVPFSTTVTVSS